MDPALGPGAQECGLIWINTLCSHSGDGPPWAIMMGLKTDDNILRRATQKHETEEKAC